MNVNEILSKIDYDKLNCRNKAIVLLAMSTDMSIETIESLKVNKFFEGMRGTFNEIDGDIKSIEELNDYINSIGSFCIWELENEKGNKYTTTSTPEVNEAIIVYLQYKLYKRGFINSDELLFDLKVG